MLTTSNLVLAAGTLTTALIGGLFFSFSTAINPALHRLSDAGYLQAFQNINKDILNPLFLFCFMAPVILLPAATWMQFKQGGPAWIWTLAGAILYVIFVFGVTAGGNVPLNDALAKMDLTHASAKTLAAYRAAFEPRWNMFHSIRTVANVLAMAVLIIACLITIKK